MNDLLQYLAKYETWVYLLLGLSAIIYLRKLFIALQEGRSAMFGLERDISQRRIASASSVLILLFLMAVAEFILATFVSPGLSASQALATPTLNLEATPFPAETQPVSENGTLVPTIAYTPTAAGTGCTTGVLEWTDPKHGGEVSGVVALKGIIQIPNFGFYKYEFAPVGSDSWTTIAAGNTLDAEGNIGNWDTSSLTPGDYQLRLVVTDNQAQAMTPCVIQVRVVAPE
ncbi:MAG: hypothetical protein ABFD44_03000 [Anaerolineaceae bacterium]